MELLPCPWCKTNEALQCDKESEIEYDISQGAPHQSRRSFNVYCGFCGSSGPNIHIDAGGNGRLLAMEMWNQREE